MPDKPTLKDMHRGAERIMTKKISAENPEGERVEFVLEEERQKWQKWYKDNGFEVEIPELKLKLEEVREVKKLIELGYVDSLAITANEIPYVDLEPAMAKGYKETNQGQFRGGGGFAKLDELETRPGFRLIFYKKVKELYQDALLVQTCGQAAEDILVHMGGRDKEEEGRIEGLFLKDYLVIQRKFTETTKPELEPQDPERHMDTINSWTMCLKSEIELDESMVLDGQSAHRFIEASWQDDPSSHGGLFISLRISSDAMNDVGTRFCRSFEFK